MPPLYPLGPYAAFFRSCDILALAGDDYGHSPVVRRHRLLARIEVDDREPAMPKPDAVAAIARRHLAMPFAVRAAMGDGVGHRPQHPLVGLPFRPADPSRNAAHDRVRQSRF